MDDLTRRFLQFEKEISLFEKRIDGDFRFWERIRHKVKRKLRVKKGDYGQAHSSALSRTDDIKKVLQLWKNLIRKNPLLAERADILFYGHPRRKKLDDGLWWDLYCDPIINCLDEDYLLIEPPYLADHLKPSKTDNIRYIDIIKYADGIRNRLGLNQPLSYEDKLKLQKVEKEIQERFEVEMDITKLANRQRIKRSTRLPLYRRVLNRVSPDIAVLVVSYGKEPFVEACRGQNIPTIELQHGVIYDEHLGYHYPENQGKDHFPDYLVTWGEFWNNTANLPLPGKRIISAGYPYLEQRQQKYNNIDSQDGILFISQGTIGKQLSKFALKVAQHPKISHDIVYKLHPGEYDRWEHEYPWLVDAPLRVIGSSGPPLYELFAKSSVQIGVGSTAVYEGLAFGLETYVYDCIDSSALQPLVKEGAAKRVTTSDELAIHIGTGRESFDKKCYFKPNATQNVCKTIKHLREKGKVFNS